MEQRIPSPIMVSPYLLRPVRSLQQAHQERERVERYEEIALRAIAEGQAAGDPPQHLVKRAVAAVIRHDPKMPYRSALALVQRIRPEP